MDSAKRLARFLRNEDVTEQKEMYRAIMQVAVEYTIARETKG